MAQQTAAQSTRLLVGQTMRCADTKTPLTAMTP